MEKIQDRQNDLNGLLVAITALVCADSYHCYLSVNARYHDRQSQLLTRRVKQALYG